MPHNEEWRNELIVEQYYLLTPDFELNTIRVSNNPSGSNVKSLYMYNRDSTILYYSTSKQIEIIRTLGVHHTTFTKHLNEGTYYLGRYLFKRELVAGCKDERMSIEALAAKLEQEREQYNSEKSYKHGRYSKDKEPEKE